jgi:hypothetical protein
MKHYLQLSGAEPDTWVEHSTSFPRRSPEFLHPEVLRERCGPRRKGRGRFTHCAVRLGSILPGSPGPLHSSNFGEDALERLRDLTQRGTVEEYTDAFEKIRKDVIVEGANESMLMHMYIWGLFPGVNGAVRAAWHPTSLLEAMRLAGLYSHRSHSVKTIANTWKTLNPTEKETLAKKWKMFSTVELVTTSFGTVTVQQNSRVSHWLRPCH